MASLFTGQQMHAFFQDPAFWGHGQSFQDLRLKVDGRLIGPDDFVSGWDPSDIPENAIVEVLAGTWQGRGFCLEDHSMPKVIKSWKRGIKPQPSMAQGQPGGSSAVVAAPRCQQEAQEEAPVAPGVQSSMARPSFMSPKAPSSNEAPAKIKRPVFSC